MRLLMFTDFGLRALMLLAAAPEQHLSTEQLARELDISRHHLQKVVQELAAAGIVRTIRGVKGGVMLAHAPEDIRVGEVTRVMERNQPIVECFRADGGACKLSPRCKLQLALKNAQDAFYASLDTHTLAEFMLMPTAR